MDTLYLVMPAYNEEVNIRQTVGDWYPVLSLGSEASAMVVNCSGSRDKTAEILKDMQHTFPRLILLEDSENTYGDKVTALYRYAIQSGADYVFQTDSDGQTDPGEFAAFWQLRRDYDAVIGNRTHRGDGSLRSMVQKAETTMVGLFFHIRIPDANVPFRLMRTVLLKNYLEILPEDYPMPNILLTALFAAGKERMTFRRISFEPRQGGKNSMNMKKILRIGWQSVGVFYRLGRRFSRGGN